MEVENITEEERKSITEDMILVADKIAQADLQKQKVFRASGNKDIVGNTWCCGIDRNGDWD